MQHLMKKKDTWMIFNTFQRNSETNDTSFEGPNIELLESGKKLAPS